jgi:hypothetical protein
MSQITDDCAAIVAATVDLTNKAASLSSKITSLEANQGATSDEVAAVADARAKVEALETTFGNVLNQ